MSLPVLCYWDIRGLAQPIRLLLNYTGTKFEDKQLSCGPAPDFDKSCWFDHKFSFGLDFPNLPYFIDGDIKLTQSHAIMRYIARKHDLCGKTPIEKARVDMVAEQVMDFRNGWVRVCYNRSDKSIEEVKEQYLKTLATLLKQFEDFLGDRAWLAGDNISFPDFHFYELLDQHKLLLPGSLKNFPKLEAYTQRFENLPAIAAYRKDPKFMVSPVNNKMAALGGK